MKINSNNNSDILTPAKIVNHIQQLTTKNNSTRHGEVLEQLLEQIVEINYLEIAYPAVKTLRKRLEELPQESEEAVRIMKRLKEFQLKYKQVLVITIENIERIAKKNNWSLCKNHDFIYIYNGCYWMDTDQDQFKLFLGEAAEKIGIEKFTARYYQFREHLFKQFMSAAYFPAPSPSINKVLINLKNGTFEITPEGIRLRSFNSNDFLRYQLPFEYNPKAEAPIFNEYLEKVLPDKERQMVLAEYLGFVFIKHGSNVMKEEKALILYGSGANGKSVFFEVVNAMLGTENVSTYSLQSLTNENGYFRAKIGNKLVNYASEINGKMETALFKQLVSGEPVEARLPYGQPFTLKEYAKLIFNTNELPKDVEQTKAFFRRFLIIPFDVTIPEEEQDKQLHQKIIDNELSGVFNWVLRGLERLLSQKRFTHCDAAMNAVKDYEKQSDSVKMFIEECGYGKSVEDYTLIKDLYREYKLYCSEDGFHPVNKTNFKKRLEGYGIIVERKTPGNVAYVCKPNSF